MRPALTRIAFAVGIIALLVVHGITWAPSQLFWACHVASLLIALGLAFDVPRLVAIGVVFHAGQGIPAWLLDLFVIGDSSISSTLLHVVPLATGLWALWPRPLPRGILIPAWLLHPLAMVLAYLFADPALNVMLVHEPYGLTAHWYGGSLALSHVANIALSFVFVSMGWLVLRLVWRRRGL